MVDEIPGYDNWKTTPPDPPRKCPDCEADSARADVVEAISDILYNYMNANSKTSGVWLLIDDEVRYVANTIGDAVEEDCYKNDGVPCVRHNKAEEE